MKDRVAALMVIVAVLALTVAIFGYQSTRDPVIFEPGDKVITLTGFANSGVWTTEEVNGLNYWWKEFEPAVLYLEQDDSVLLRLLSADLLHKFYAPRLRLGPVTVKPGHPVELRFTADEVGIFQYYCTATCGSCHFYMRGWIVISEKGAEPVVPPPILCPLCLPDFGPPPEGPELIPLGEYLYVQKGCSTCHGFEARGGVENPNFTTETVPAHHRTAEKFFLQDPEEAECFIAMLQEDPGLETLSDADGISRGRLVEARLDMAREIIANGKYSAKMDPEGPEPPLQMPAWQYIIDDREINALLAYFVSLMPREEEDDL